MNSMLLIAAGLVAGAYLLGSISSAIVVCRLMGLPDPRTQGSNNPGATNVLRIGGAKAKKAAGITLNKNTVPGETRSPFVTSGLRIGTAALTTRGMGELEMHRIGEWMARVLAAPDDDRLIQRTREEVAEMASGFPLYGELVAG